MKARDIIQKRLNHEGTEITPFTVSFESGLYSRLTEYYKDENWERKKLKKYLCSFLGVDTVQMRRIDDIYSMDAYGALWRMDKKPFHLEKPPISEPVFNNYKFPEADIFVNPILTKKEEAKKRYEADSEHYRVINMGWGIFENTWRILGFENALMYMVTNEDFYAELTVKMTNNYIAMIKACEGVAADAFLFGDDWGDQRGVIMGAARWRKFIKPCLERIYAEVHQQGKKTIQHSCGSIIDIYDDLAEIGMDCHESVQPEARGMKPELIKEKWGKKISFWGCLGSQGILHFGTPSEIRAEILRLHNLFKEDGGYVLSPAKPLPENMDIEKAVAVVETLTELGAQV